jgi:hypothetical protein
MTLLIVKCGINQGRTGMNVIMPHNGSRLGEVVERKTSLELQMFKLR